MSWKFVPRRKSSLLLLFCCFETQCHYVVQDTLELRVYSWLALNLKASCSASWVMGLQVRATMSSLGKIFWWHFIRKLENWKTNFQTPCALIQLDSTFPPSKYKLTLFQEPLLNRISQSSLQMFSLFKAQFKVHPCLTSVPGWKVLVNFCPPPKHFYYINIKC